MPTKYCTCKWLDKYRVDDKKTANLLCHQGFCAPMCYFHIPTENITSFCEEIFNRTFLLNTVEHYGFYGTPQSSERARFDLDLHFQGKCEQIWSISQIKDMVKIVQESVQKFYAHSGIPRKKYLKFYILTKPVKHDSKTGISKQGLHLEFLFFTPNYSWEYVVKDLNEKLLRVFGTTMKPDNNFVHNSWLLYGCHKHNDEGPAYTVQFVVKHRGTIHRMELADIMKREYHYFDVDDEKLANLLYTENHNFVQEFWIHPLSSLSETLRVDENPMLNRDFPLVEIEDQEPDKNFASEKLELEYIFSSLNDSSCDNTKIWSRCRDCCSVIAHTFSLEDCKEIFLIFDSWSQTSSKYCATDLVDQWDHNWMTAKFDDGSSQFLFKDNVQFCWNFLRKRCKGDQSIKTLLKDWKQIANHAQVIKEISNGRILYLSDTEQWFYYDEDRAIWCQPKHNNIYLPFCQELLTYTVNSIFVKRINFLTKMVALEKKKSKEDRDKSFGEELKSEKILYETLLNTFRGGRYDRIFTNQLLAIMPSDTTSSIFLKHPELFPLKNKMCVNLCTGMIRERERNDYLNFITNIEIVNDIDDAKKYFFDIMNDVQDRLEYFVMLTLYLLSGYTFDNRLYIIHGNGQNGKSQYMKIMQRILTKKMSFAVPSDTIISNGPSHQNNPALKHMMSKRYVCLSETNDGDRFRDDAIKSLTGDDVDASRNNHGNDFDGRLDHSAKLMIGTNHVIEFKTDKKHSAVVKRLVHIPFEHVFEEDRKIAKFRSEDFLNQFVSYCVLMGKDLLSAHVTSEQKFKLPDSIMINNDTIIENFNYIKMFVKSMIDDGILETGDQKIISKDDISDLYERWLRENYPKVPFQRNKFKQAFLCEPGISEGNQKGNDRTRKFQGIGRCLQSDLPV